MTWRGYDGLNFVLGLVGYFCFTVTGWALNVLSCSLVYSVVFVDNGIGSFLYVCVYFHLFGEPNDMFIQLFYLYTVQIGNDQEMALSERNSHSTNQGVGKKKKKKKKKKTSRYLYQEQLFPNRRPLSYPNLNKI